MRYSRGPRRAPAVVPTVIALALILAVAGALSVEDAYAFPTGGEPVTLEGEISAEEHGDDPESNLPFLFAVFFITWAAFFAYVFVMSRRQREMQGDIEALKRVIADQEERATPAESERESAGS